MGRCSLSQPGITDVWGHQCQRSAVGCSGGRGGDPGLWWLPGMGCARHRFPEADHTICTLARTSVEVLKYCPGVEAFPTAIPQPAVQVYV